MFLRWLRNNATGKAIVDVAARQRGDNTSLTLTELMSLPKPSLYLMSTLHILVSSYGLGYSMEKSLPVDGAGNAIPLYTYPSIDYLEQLDFSESSVFEYGSGMSTLW